MKKYIGWYFVAIIVLISTMTACGNGQIDNKSDVKVTPDATLNVTATNFKFNKKTFTIPANKNVEVNFKSKLGYHGFSIVGTHINIRGNGKKIINLKPGQYTIKCSVPCGSGHEQMKSTLNVK